MARAFIFPGQGSQAVGMGADLADNFPVARDVFDEVDDVLSQKLSKLMREGPIEDLTLTANAQPALMAHSMAAMRVLEKEAGVDIASAKFVAGHSLGEYSALCAARAISLPDTARLLRIRGEAMQAAVPVGQGAMAALIGAHLDTVEKALAEMKFQGVCEIANDNAPGQVVISGTKKDVEAVCAAAKSIGAKMAKILPVSAPFHSSLMQPAAARMEEALAEAAIAKPNPALVANVTAQDTRDPDVIRSLLVDQVTGRVRWTQSVDFMASNGVEQFIEIGAGKVLSGLVKRIAKGAETVNLGVPTDFDDFLNA